jgi:hypothetical protein
MKTVRSSLFPLSAVLILMLLPSCKPLDWIKSKFGGGSQTSRGASASAVLLTIEGQPALTSEEFEKYYEQVLEQQPQLRSFAAMMPDLKENIYATLASQKILEYWAKKHKIDQKLEYQADRQALLENVERGLAIKYFQAEHPVMISDEDIKAFYDANKDSLYVLAQGGANAVGVSFDNQAAAKTFLEKAKQPKADISKLAGASKLTARNFGRVHDQSAHVEEGLRKQILGMKNTVALLPVGKNYWVVQLTAKEDAKYYPFEQAKEDVRTRLNNDRMVEMFNTELGKLKNEYNVVEHKDYFGPKKEEAESVADNKDEASAPAPKTV